MHTLSYSSQSVDLFSLSCMQCGFFRRAKHEEIKQKREELQNLADNGVTAETGGAGDGTNL